MKNNELKAKFDEEIELLKRKQSVLEAFKKAEMTNNPKDLKAATYMLSHDLKKEDQDEIIEYARSVIDSFREYNKRKEDSVESLLREAEENNDIYKLNEAKKQVEMLLNGENKTSAMEAIKRGEEVIGAANSLDNIKNRIKAATIFGDEETINDIYDEIEEKYKDDPENYWDLKYQISEALAAIKDIPEVTKEAEKVIPAAPVVEAKPMDIPAAPVVEAEPMDIPKAPVVEPEPMDIPALPVEEDKIDIPENPNVGEDKLKEIETEFYGYVNSYLEEKDNKYLDKAQDLISSLILSDLVTSSKEAQETIENWQAIIDVYKAKELKKSTEEENKTTDTNETNFVLDIDDDKKDNDRKDSKILLEAKVAVSKADKTRTTDDINNAIRKLKDVNRAVYGKEFDELNDKITEIMAENIFGNNSLTPEKNNVPNPEEENKDISLFEYAKEKDLLESLVELETLSKTNGEIELSSIEELIESAKKLPQDTLDQKGYRNRVNNLIDYYNAKKAFVKQNDYMNNMRTKVSLFDILAQGLNWIESSIAKNNYESNLKKLRKAKKDGNDFRIKRYSSKVEKATNMSNVALDAVKITTKKAKLFSKKLDKKKADEVQKEIEKTTNGFNKKVYDELEKRIDFISNFSEKEEIMDLATTICNCLAFTHDKNIINLSKDFISRVEMIENLGGITNLESESIRHEIESVTNFYKYNNEDYVSYDPSKFKVYKDDSDYAKYGIKSLR